MDSGNSGSIQSSSNGGDEELHDEYDSSISRPENVNHSPLPSFFNNFNPNFQNQNQNQNQPIFFDNNNPNSFLNPFSSNPNPSFLNLDLIRPGSGLRIPDPHGSSSSSQQVLDRTGGPIRNPKKRTRASRRAPTTVLTTDTSNFRAMVQEFTGIPAPPFSGSPYSRRFDLFSASGSGMRSGFEPFGSLFRPLAAQRVPTPLVSNAFNPATAQNPAVSFLPPQPLLQPPPPDSNVAEFGLNFSSASDFRLENVSNSRGEGTYGRFMDLPF